MFNAVVFQFFPELCVCVTAAQFAGVLQTSTTFHRINRTVVQLTFITATLVHSLIHHLLYGAVLYFHFHVKTVVCLFVKTLCIPLNKKKPQTIWWKTALSLWLMGKLQANKYLKRYCNGTKMELVTRLKVHQRNMLICHARYLLGGPGGLVLEDIQVFLQVSQSFQAGQRDTGVRVQN